MDKQFLVMCAKDLEGEWEVHSFYSNQEDAERFLNLSSDTLKHQFWKIEQVWSYPF